MKIKLAILDHDANYLSRIASVFTTRFSDKLEIYSFTDAQVALANLKTSKINAFIASEAFEIDTASLPMHCGFAYFMESAGIETFKDKPAICKYQKVEMIYKTILEIFSNHVSDAVGIKLHSDRAVKTVTFVSAAGGTGSSSAAAACAKSFAANGQNTLYLNLEQFGSTAPFFTGPGQTDLGDVISALKSKKSNLSLKLASNARQDASGVYFYATPQYALHMAELKTEEIQNLITDLKLAASYENIIFDIDFSLNASAIEIFRQSSAIVFVLDGSEISNVKFIRAYNALEILDENSEVPLSSRLAILYNKFSSKTGKAIDNGVRTIGGAPRYEHASTKQVVNELLKLDIFQNI